VIASTTSANFVAIPSRPETISQKSAPGPPIVIAVETPAMLPTPTVEASAVATAWNGVTVPSARVFEKTCPSTSRSALTSQRNCTPRVSSVR
jgi:hypothetical protein